MATWYRIWGFSTSGPEPIEVEKESAVMVTVVHRPAIGNPFSRREAKDSNGCAIRQTARECWQWLIDQRKADVDKAERDLLCAKDELAEAERAAAEAEGVKL